jgi:hypothetical protein
MVDLERFELSTSSLQMMRSSQLNYRPIIALRATVISPRLYTLRMLWLGLATLLWRSGGHTWARTRDLSLIRTAL